MMETSPNRFQDVCIIPVPFVITRSMSIPTYGVDMLLLEGGLVGKGMRAFKQDAVRRRPPDRRLEATVTGEILLR